MRRIKSMRRNLEHKHKEMKYKKNSETNVDGIEVSEEV